MTEQSLSPFGGPAGVTTDQEAIPYNNERSISTAPRETTEDGDQIPLQQSPQAAQQAEVTSSDRPRRINNGVLFLRNSSVKTSTLQRRVAFLEKKGLSLEEIHECFNIVAREGQDQYTLDTIQEVSRNSRSNVMASDARINNNRNSFHQNMRGPHSNDAIIGGQSPHSNNDSYNNAKYLGHSGGHSSPNYQGAMGVPQYQQQSFLPSHDHRHSPQYMPSPTQQSLHHLHPESLHHTHGELGNVSSGMGWKDIFISATIASMSAMGMYEAAKSLLPYEMVHKEEVKRLRKSERERDRLLIGGPKMAALMEMRKQKSSRDVCMTGGTSDDVNPTIFQIFGSSENDVPDTPTPLPSVPISVTGPPSPTTEVGKEHESSAPPLPSTEKDKTAIELEEKSAALDKCRREKADLAVNNGKLKAEITRLNRALEKSQEEAKAAQAKVDGMMAEKQEEGKGEVAEKEHDQGQEDDTGNENGVVSSSTPPSSLEVTSITKVPLVNDVKIDKRVPVASKKKKGRK